MKYFFLIIMLSFTLNAQTKSEPSTVNHVDLKKYTGLWYEIARIPNDFQEDCVGGTTAEYSLMEDGRIKVVNSCIEKDGEKEVAEGVAKIVDKKSNAKLKVSFVSFLGIRPFWGDYWIIGLDKDYKYAVVGHPERKYGWILSRSEEISDSHLKEVYNILNKNGYNKENFVFTKQ